MNLTFFFTLSSLLQLHEAESLLRTSLRGTESGQVGSPVNTPLKLLVP